MIPIEVNGHTVLGFDSGLNSRSFAKARFTEFMYEPGVIVRDGSVEPWKALGVFEKETVDGASTMVIWGPLFEGERLDLLLNENDRQDEKLAAIVRWIQAVVLLGEDSGYDILPWPCTVIIGTGAEIFFAPPKLARHCMLTYEHNHHYVHSGLGMMDSFAFTAAAMLYHVISGVPPFPATDESTLQQDIHEGNFLPIHFAVPGLDPRLASAIQNALESRTEGSIEKRINKSVSGKIADGVTLLGEMLTVLKNDRQTASVASLIQPLSEENRILLEKEKAKFIAINTASVRIKRFVTRNKIALIAGLAALVIVVSFIGSMAKSRAGRPTTSGMEPVQVIESYYNAFGELDHQMMEACVIGKAGKDDIGMVLNFFAISKIRQSYEFGAPSLTMSARQWQQEGGGVPPLIEPSLITVQVFGVTNLSIERLGDKGDEIPCYRADYTLWVPVTGDEFEREVDIRIPLPYNHRDIITLVRKKGNWRITEIVRD